jgi:hypothetical protein
VIGHTGKDLHPEQKRLTTLPFFKEEQTAVDFFDEWPAEAESLVGERFGGLLVNLEKTVSDYDPDDAYPWEWNFQADLFGTQFGTWRDFHYSLIDVGPVE